jgi:hypothetical protein
MRRLLALGIGLLFVGLGVSGITAAAPVAAHITSHPLPEFEVTKEGSYNWGGYVATGANGSVTAVAGSWVQPTGKCTKSTSYAAFWVGIDGFNSNDLYQTGTQIVCTSGTATYGAWWEILPASETPISMTVNPGDTISASVTYSTSTGHFTLAIKDITRSESYSHVSGSATSATRDAADWITETPTVGGSLARLADFGTVDWGSKYTSQSGTNDATIANTTGAIGSFSTVYEISIYNYPGATKVMAAPTALASSGSSFTVKWKSAGP